MRFQFIFSILFFIATSGIAQDLTYYIEQAKRNSPLIQDNANQSEAARLEAERLKAFYTKPQVSLTGSYLFAPVVSNSKLVLNPSGSEEKYAGYDLAASNGGVYQGLITINQPLFNGSRYEATAEQTLIGAKINENTIQLTSHDLEKFVTDQYILCLQDYKQTEFLSALIGIISDQKNIVVKLVENGMAKQSDLSLLIIEQKVQMTAHSTFKTTYRRDLMDLRVLCGISDTTFQVLNDINLIPGEDVATSKFVERYRLDSLNLLAAQKVFELKYKPTVGAFANTGLNAVYAPTIANRFGLSAGINLSLNITDGHQRDLAQQRTAVLMRSAGVYKNYFYDQNKVRKSKILVELNSITERIVLTEDQLKEFQKLLDLYKLELSRGQISVINYINVLKNMATTQRDFVLLQSNKQLLINLYNYWNW